MNVFTKLRRYGTSQPPMDAYSASEEQSGSGTNCNQRVSSDLPTSKISKNVTWVTTSPSHQSQTVFSSWKNNCYRIILPTLKTLGQCVFGMAIVFILAGIALCIFGYVGEPIRPFQIFGPVCIGIGLFIYIVGCFVCCREYPAFAKVLQERSMKQKVQKAMELFMDQDVVTYIQSEPELLGDFKELTSRILQQTCYLDNGNVITNVYASSTEKDGEQSQ